MAEADELRRLRDARDAAAAAYDRQIVHLYLVGVSTTSIANALDVTKQNIGNMIRRRRAWFGAERIPRRTG
jgi:DNA-directed RNA polymerase specialized sigma24 family protein